MEADQVRQCSDSYEVSWEDQAPAMRIGRVAPWWDPRGVERCSEI